jgi:hypothetical protein
MDFPASGLLFGRDGATEDRYQPQRTTTDAKRSNGGFPQNMEGGVVDWAANANKKWHEGCLVGNAISVAPAGTE